MAGEHVYATVNKVKKQKNTEANNVNKTIKRISLPPDNTYSTLGKQTNQHKVITQVTSFNLYNTQRSPFASKLYGADELYVKNLYTPHTSVKR